MSSMNSSSDDPAAPLTEKLVIDYLNQHPNFLKSHPELLEVLVPPEQQTGKKVLDFQNYALGSLRKNMQEMKDRFQGLLSSARDNMSVQSQVHKAALHVLKARNLDQLIEVLTQDLLRYFDVDAVRLVIESNLADLYEEGLDDGNPMSLRFVPMQTVDLILGPHQPIALVSDSELDPPYAYEQIFFDCADLVQSCALLRIYLSRIDHYGIVAFGVREKGRFHPHLGVELLQFLSEVIAHRLDACLNDADIDRLSL